MNRLVFVFLIFFSKCLLAQTDYYTYTLEDQWWQPELGLSSKEFIKIPVSENGIYRVNFSDLASKGFLFTNEDEIQLFRKGIEQSIFISPNNYIEFYGEKNDGQLDKELYFPSTAQPHSYHNLFTDTATYFLTATNGVAGKRVSSFTTNSGNSSTYHIQEKIELFTNTYAEGRNLRAGIKSPFFDYGEGWLGTSIGPTTATPIKIHDFSIDNIVNLVDASSDGIYPTLELLLVGASGDLETHRHYVDLYIDGISVASDTFVGYNSRLVSVQLQNSNIINDQLDIQLRISAGGNYNNRIKIGYAKVRFPQTYDMAGNSKQYFGIPSQSSGVTSIGITGTNSGSLVYDITENGNFKRSVASNTLNVNNIGVEKKIFVSDLTDISTIPLIYLKNTTIEAPDSTSDYLIVTNKIFANEAENYRAYRASNAGGNYNAKIYYVSDLYNVFTYGDYSALAIRRFCDYMLSKNSAKMHMFLLGKGARVDVATFLNNTLKYYRYDRENVTIERPLNSGQFLKNFNYVPTPGTPGGDVFFSAHIVDSIWTQGISTGRLAAVLPSEITAYLDKVITFESTEDTTLWSKNVLHLAGGNSISEISQFCGYADGWRNIAVSPLFGGNVETICKTSLGITNITVTDQVNKGVKLITFFGHSSAHQSDIDIGKVSDITKGYNNNNGRFPIILLNGCQSGDMFSRGFSFGEDWILTPNVGAIGFIASSTTAFANQLKTYTDRFYDVSFRDSVYHESTIGEVMQEVVNRVKGALDFGHFLNINLHGDPAISAFGKNKPDLEVNNNSLFLQPINEPSVTAVSDTFNLGIVVRNFGKYESDNDFFVSVERTYGGNVVEYAPKLFNSVDYEDTLYFGISSKSIETFGLNTFSVHIDFNSDLNVDNVDESNELNNEAFFTYQIPLSGMKNIFPPEFSMIGENNFEYGVPIDLIAQSTDLLVNNKDYLFELDTTMQFNSPLYESEIINAGAVVTWRDAPIDDMILKIDGTGQKADSTVFYWRVRFKDQEIGADTLYGESSFQYNYNSPGGWSQSHFYQYQRDEFEFIDLNNAPEWKFQKLISSIKMSGSGVDASLGVYPSQQLNNDNPFLSGNKKRGGFLCLVVDDKFFSYVTNLSPGGTTPQFSNTTSIRQYKFNIQNVQHMLDFPSFINAIPDGNYVAILTSDVTNYSSIANITGVQNAFSSIGSNSFSSIVDGQGFMILGRKNGSAIFETFLDSTQTLDTSFTLESSLDFGNIVSTIIGPSTKWLKVFHDMKYNDLEDEYAIEVYGLDSAKANEALLYTINSFTGDLDISNLDETRYPFLKLVARKKDSKLKTPPQLNNWAVSYESKIPEGTIVSDDDYKDDPFVQGEMRTYNVKFKNISKYDFLTDSLVVETSFLRGKNSFDGEVFKILAPKSEEEVSFQYELNTSDLEGKYILHLTVNPEIELEHYYTNNTLSIDFDVIGDNINPLLDVTFDGLHIMDFDIVSANPKIVISMKDENKFLHKTDLEGIKIFLKTPNDESYPNVNYTTTGLVTFTPASEKNDLEIIFSPQKGQLGSCIEPYLCDGVYTLSVQVEDAKGNQSGTDSRPYEINFEVISKTTVTNFFPYPNPFSTRMRFAYTLTGYKQPENIKIQIMTITGKIVREINEDELGFLRIGKHLTDFSWDGTDEFGDKLANGVYLYRVLMEDDQGNTIENRTAGTKRKSKSNVTTADSMFKKGWGKLYILR